MAALIVGDGNHIDLLYEAFSGGGGSNLGAVLRVVLHSTPAAARTVRRKPRPPRTPPEATHHSAGRTGGRTRTDDVCCDHRGGRSKPHLERPAAAASSSKPQGVNYLSLGMRPAKKTSGSLSANTSVGHKLHGGFWWIRITFVALFGVRLTRIPLALASLMQASDGWRKGKNEAARRPIETAGSAGGRSATTDRRRGGTCARNERTWRGD